MPIEIVEYDPRWPLEFEVLRSRLLEALGELALRIDPIGSTAVPGLAAKDVLNVQIVVRDLEHPRLRPALEGLGLVWRMGPLYDHLPAGLALAPEQLEKRYAKAPPTGRAAHVHLRLEGRFNTRYALLCRDYLRTHPEASAAYAEIKR